jgi:hypothetical protein
MPRLPLSLLVLVLVAPACGHGGRYLSTIRGPVPLEAVAAANRDPALDQLLDEAKADAERAGLLAGITERIHLTLDGRVASTVVIEGGRASITRGIAAGVTPTLTVPVTPAAMRNLRAAVADGKLDEQEVFNFSHVLFVPCLRRLHGMFYFVEPGDKSNLLVDNHMQFRLKNPKGLTYHGEGVDIAVTVLNVDGRFFYLPGFVGDPDARYELAIGDAIELYKMLIYEAERHRNDMLQLIKLGERTKEMLERSTTYVRAWH